MKSLHFAALGIIALGTTGVLANSFGDKKAGKTEDWLYSLMPESMPESSLMQSLDDSRVTYKMDKSTYETLDPIGIACQQWRTPTGNYDAVIIAATQMGAFHDQQICFRAQGWNILTVKNREVETKSHGSVPFTVMELENNLGAKQFGIYAFRPPGGFSGYANGDIGFVKYELSTLKPGIGFSYRFIGLDNDQTEDDVINFAKTFLEDAKESSNGVL